MALKRSVRALVGPVVFLSVVACGSDRSSGAPDSSGAMSGVSTWPADDTGAGVAAAHPGPATPARDADQLFLRRMLDHHETVVAHAHAAMMSEGGHAVHGGGSDPAAFDASLDADKLRMLALLDSVYGEKYSPHPADTAGLNFAERLRAGLRLIDESAPKLRRSAVRDIARRIRETHVQILLQEDSAAAAPDKH